MRKSLKSVILLSLVSLMIFAAGASMTIAYPGNPAECGPSCHSTSSITVTSNATGTVSATKGVPFILNIDAVGYTGGDQQFYVAIEPGWADNDQFDFTATSIQDDGVGDLDGDPNEISISVDFTPKDAGTFTLRIWAAGKNDVAGFLDVAVLAEYDANAPIIDNPVDIEYEYQETGSQIIWNATDPNPVNYTIFRNAVPIVFGGWNGSLIFISVDYLIPGIYEYTLTVTNIGGYSASDTVIVTVIAPPVTTTTTTTTPTTTDTTTDTTTNTTTAPTTSAPPAGQPLDPAVVTPLALVVGTWAGIIVVVLLISEILIRKGRW